MYALEEGLDYEVDDIIRGGYDPKKERKLVLKRHGHDLSDKQQSSIEREGGNDREVCEVKMDKVWQDARIQSLLNENNEPSAHDDNSATNIHHVSSTKGRMGTIRQSYIRLPDTAYSLLTVDQVLRRIMPTKDNGNDNGTTSNPIIEEIPSSFEIAGHIAHLNLREEALPYKYLIGKAILDKNGPKIKLVVNKIGNIENEFRTFPMEILAGECLNMKKVETLCHATTSSNETVQVKIGPQHESLMKVEVKEHGCRFQLDFARVYFNSRLQSEHARLVQQIVEDARRNSRTKKKEEEECIVADAMAGVGPFAIPLTSSNAPHYSQTKIICHANDLNPTSYEYLQKNAKLNKCYADRLTMYNLDGREFIHRMNKEGVNVDHFIMNLPQLAPEFLDAFRGWNFNTSCDDDDVLSNIDTRRQPMIHVHCFGEKARCPEDIVRIERQLQERCEQALGCQNCFSEHGISSSSMAVTNEFQVRIVRDVGPRKNMFCVSFRLPFEVEKVEKLVLAKKGGDKNDESADNISNGKRERICEVNINEDVESKPSKRSKDA